MKAYEAGGYLGRADVFMAGKVLVLQGACWLHIWPESKWPLSLIRRAIWGLWAQWSEDWNN